MITHKFRRTLVAQGISIAVAVHSLDLLVCAFHNLTNQPSGQSVGWVEERETQRLEIERIGSRTFYRLRYQDLYRTP